MHSIWEILGIEPTTDKKTIKKAYAAKLKITSPEDDPEGFQILRGAYEAALTYEEVPDYENISYEEESDDYGLDFSGEEKRERSDIISQGIAREPVANPEKEGTENTDELRFDPADSREKAEYYFDLLGHILINEGEEKAIEFFNAVVEEADDLYKEHFIPMLYQATKNWGEEDVPKELFYRIYEYFEFPGKEKYLKTKEDYEKLIENSDGKESSESTGYGCLTWFLIFAAVKLFIALIKEFK